MDELMEVFTIFKNNSRKFIVNQSHPHARQLSQDIRQDFSLNSDIAAGYIAERFQAGWPADFIYY